MEQAPAHPEAEVMVMVMAGPLLAPGPLSLSNSTENSNRIQSHKRICKLEAHFLSRWCETALRRDWTLPDVDQTVMN